MGDLMTDTHTRNLVLKEDDVVADKYRIRRKLAEGGMGAVFHAVQEPLGRDVALKTVKDLGDDEEKREERFKRFFREASYSSKLNHPNTVTIFDYGKLPGDGGFYLVMEYLEGRSLRDLMKSRGRLSVPMTLHICTQIASSLTEAHDMGVIHRDLKPPNVMLVHRGDDPHFVKVVDFGLVKELEPKSRDEELTAENALIGSPRYMAPERFLYHSADSPSVDVYALGIMLYEMLVGRPPFVRSPESTLQHIMMQHVQDEPPPIGKFAPDLQLPAGLESLIMRCLAKEPGERPAMVALARLLKACASGEPSIADEIDSLPTIDDVRPVMPGETSDEFVTEDTGRGERYATGDATRPDLPNARREEEPVPTHTVAPVDKPTRSPIAMIVAIVSTLLFIAVGIGIFVSSSSPTSTRLHVASDPPGAYVYLGPKQLGQTPFDVELEIEQATTLRFTKEGHPDQKFVLSPGMGESFDVAVDLGEPVSGTGAAAPDDGSAKEGASNPGEEGAARTGSGPATDGDATGDETAETAETAETDESGEIDLEEAQKAKAAGEAAEKEKEIKEIKKRRRDRPDPRDLDIKMDR